MKRRVFVGFVLPLIAWFSAAASDVIVLDSANFKEKVGTDDSLWLIEFYAPWCGHCKRFSSTFEEIATDLKGKVKVAKVDAIEHRSLSAAFGVRSFPSFFHVKGTEVRKYSKTRDAETMKDWALSEYKSDKVLDSWSSPFGPIGSLKFAALGIIDKFQFAHNTLVKKYELPPPLAAFLVIGSGVLGLLGTLTVLVGLMIKLFDAYVLRTRAQPHLHQD